MRFSPFHRWLEYSTCGFEEDMKAFHSFDYLRRGRLHFVLLLQPILSPVFDTLGPEARYIARSLL